MADLLTGKRKDQITEVAQNLFKERGYAATSMRDLAKAVGVEPASLYSHIRSKEELLSNICHRIADEFLIKIEEVLQLDSSPVDQFRLAVIAHVKVIVHNLDATAVFFNEWRHLSGEELALFMHKRRKYEDYFRSILVRGIDDKVFKETEVPFAMRLMFSVLNGTHEWYHREGRLKPEEIGNRICELLLNGMFREIDNPTL